jgi:23S rRNA-/tRNA-specific pseudouridylate synthase
MLEVRPTTGRFHQIRRHLSYCLGFPVVGDAKYDCGGSLAKSLRTRDMFLCAKSLEFRYPPALSPLRGGDNPFVTTTTTTAATDSEGMFQVEIPLPDKFDLLMSPTNIISENL